MGCKRKIATKIREDTELNGYEDTTYQKFNNSAKLTLRGNFIAVDTFIQETKIITKKLISVSIFRKKIKPRERQKKLNNKEWKSMKQKMCNRCI